MSIHRKYYHIIIGFMVAVTSLSTQSCKDDPETVDSIVVKESEIAINDAGGTTEIGFTASGRWTAEVSADWVTLDRVEGMGTYLTKVNVTVKTNELYEPRTAVITIYCGTSKSEITINQDKNSKPLPEELDPEQIPDYDKYYKPVEFASMNMLMESSQWSFFRHQQSEHFFVFWEPGFGDDPNSENLDETLRVDIDDLLAKAEQFYKTNIDVLKFAEVGQNKSYLDKYKMQIYLHYTKEWMAYGSGYDNTIGALWVNPSTCKPVGSTIAHEIGHSFQYQVYCDKLLNGAPDDLTQGFRYGFTADKSGGNSFWEQCAQWQSFQDYPNELFGGHLNVFKANSHRHFNHEWMRYASYWLQYYWTQKHGIEAVGEIWKQSYFPEDPLMTYQRLYCGNSLDNLYEELYDYATRMITYDIDVIRNYANANALNHSIPKMFEAGSGYYQVGYASAPGTTGYNIIPLNLPEGGNNTIAVTFEGLPVGSNLAESDPGIVVDADGKEVGKVKNYNASDNTDSGWRYGFVSVINGVAQYAPMSKEKSATVSYNVPTGTTHLYLVVMGAPGTYESHPWNDNELDDAQWPYKLKFTGTDLLGSFLVDETADPQDITLTYDLNCNATSADFQLGTVNLALSQRLAQAFAMKPSTLEGKLLEVGKEPAEDKVVIALLQSDNSYAYEGSANNGFWCTADGNRTTWGSNHVVFVEFAGLNLNYGHLPGGTTAGQRFTVKPTFIYTKNGIQYKATVVVNMQF